MSLQATLAHRYSVDCTARGYLGACYRRRRTTNNIANNYIPRNGLDYHAEKGTGTMTLSSVHTLRDL
jgi:hypothetical protein